MIGDLLVFGDALPEEEEEPRVIVEDRLLALSKANSGLDKSSELPLLCKR